MADVLALGAIKGFGISLNCSTFQHVGRKHYHAGGTGFVQKFGFEVNILRVGMLPILANPAGAPPSVFQSCGQL